MVKGLVELIQFNVYSTALTTNLLSTIPQYIIVFLMVLISLFIIGIFFIIYKIIATIRYYIKRKYDSIDNYTNKNSSDNFNEQTATYKEIKKRYKKDASELEAHIMPDGQNIINVVDKINELRKKK